MPGTAHILNGALSISWIVKLSKSQTQPDGGEGCSSEATGYPATVLGKETALLRQGTADARGNEQDRRAWWDEPTIHGKILYPFLNSKFKIVSGRPFRSDTN